MYAHLSSVVQMYNTSFINSHTRILHEFVTHSQNDQLPVGWIAQLVEHWTDMSSFFFFLFFFHSFFSQLLKLRRSFIYSDL